MYYSSRSKAKNKSKEPQRSPRILGLGLIKLDFYLNLTDDMIKKFKIDFSQINSPKDLAFIAEDPELLDLIQISSSDALSNILLYINKASVAKSFVELITLSPFRVHPDEEHMKKIFTHVTEHNYLFSNEMIVTSLPNKISFAFKNGKKLLKYFDIITDYDPYTDVLSDSNNNKYNNNNNYNNDVNNPNLEDDMDETYAIEKNKIKNKKAGDTYDIKEIDEASQKNNKSQHSKRNTNKAKEADKKAHDRKQILDDNTNDDIIVKSDIYNDVNNNYELENQSDAYENNNKNNKLANKQKAKEMFNDEGIIYILYILYNQTNKKNEKIFFVNLFYFVLNKINILTC